MADTILLNGDAFSELKKIPSQSVDFIFTDPDYGTTNNKWDKPINFTALWPELWRVLKLNGCIAVWAQSPFDKTLACTCLKYYRYEWIIEKTNSTGHLNAKKMPMKSHENVLVFYKKLPTYNPQFTKGHEPVHNYTKHTTDGSNYGTTRTGISGGGSTQRYPRDVLKFPWDTQKSNLHPTQKPLAACEYFIKTYTNPGDTVLDCFMGSGTTGVAARKLGRKFIGIELEKQFYNTALERIFDFKK